MYSSSRPAGWAGNLGESGKLTASVRTAGALFGLSVGVDGDTAVAGAHGEAGGAAYVFVKPGTGWAGSLTQSARLTPAAGGAGTLFGWAVAVSGSTVAVGAYGEGSSRGAVTSSASPQQAGRERSTRARSSPPPRPRPATGSASPSPRAGRPSSRALRTTTPSPARPTCSSDPAPAGRACSRNALGSGRPQARLRRSSACRSLSQATSSRRVAGATTLRRRRVHVHEARWRLGGHARPDRAADGGRRRGRRRARRLRRPGCRHARRRSERRQR